MAKSNLLKATLNLKKAEKDYEMKKNLFGEGIISLKELIDSEIELQIFDSERKSAREELKLLLEGKEREKLSLESKLKRAEKAYDLAKAQVYLANKRLEGSSIESSIRGIILELSKKEGEFVSEGEKIGIISPLSNVSFVLDMSQDKITKIKEGQEVTIFLDSFPFRKYKIFEGEVQMISPKAEISGGRYLFKIKIPLREPWVDTGEKKNTRIYLKPGLSGKAKIITNKNIKLIILLLNKFLYKGS